MREAIGAPVPPHERKAHEAEVEAVRAAVGPERFTAAEAAGRAQALAEVVADARRALGC